MENIIVNIIDQYARDKYLLMTEDAIDTYRRMVYAGIQITLNDHNVLFVAKELKVTPHVVSHFIRQWCKLIESNDPHIISIMKAYRQEQKRERKEGFNFRVRTKKKTHNSLGFVFTEEDERRERAAIRDSILFFQTYGQGAKPRTKGEYYTPGTNPSDIEAKKQWLPQATASTYCNCTENTLIKAAQAGEIERRPYKMRQSKVMYEYLISDLDKFIKAHQLL